MRAKLEITNEDNMALMARYSDNYFDLAIVDPPYGIGEKFKGGKSGKMQFNEVVEKGWDCVPNEQYFKELFRVSKNQIIWGGNYFDLPPTRCFIVWDKCISDDFTLAMAELAWTSFDKLAKIFKYSVPKDGKIHPTQKPIDLYKWLLDKYAKCHSCNDRGWIWLTKGSQTDCPKCKGNKAKILDTHLGSGSIAIACWDLKFDLTACELDKEYYDKAMERINNHTKQTQLF
jgi:site-specific DNA-methyltransferase (adenine-specific)